MWVDAAQAVGQEGDEPVGGLRVAVDGVEDTPFVHAGLESADDVGQGTGVVMAGQDHDRLLVGTAHEGVVGGPDVGAVCGAQGGHVVGEGVEGQCGVLGGDREPAAQPRAEPAFDHAGCGPVVREQAEEAVQDGAGQGAREVLGHGDGVVPGGGIGAGQLCDEEVGALGDPIAQGGVQGAQDAADRGVFLPGMFGVEEVGGQVSGANHGGDAPAADVARRLTPAASVAWLPGGRGRGDLSQEGDRAGYDGEVGSVRGELEAVGEG
ncbi:hypothetical protein ACFY9A_34005 [Streptomyces rubradiris]|uniref:hypothetical protein n=1 Tax=Streptomyces rubradiris TaxID=285531 RepID=UPI0036E241BE